MANVFDVARYIIEQYYSSEKVTIELTAMKLQKLVYYSQSWTLAWDEKPLFDEEFEAWANGPVCRELYDRHKGLFVIKESSLMESGNSSNLTKEQKQNIDIVLGAYGNKAPQWLSDLTHQEFPWRNARGNTPVGEPSQNIITKESMQQFYSGLGA